MKRNRAVRLSLFLAAVIPIFAKEQPPLVPLVFVHGEDEATTRKVIREVAEGGNTGFVWESRPHPDYLGPKWWSDLAIAIDEAKKNDLEMWLFDEWMYPSGIAGGKVVAENPDFAVHVIEDRSVTVKGPIASRDFVMPGEARPIVSVSAFRRGSDPVDLTARGRHINWTVPDGEWRIVWVVERVLTPRPGWVMDNMIDVMNPKAAQTFIRLTHEATYAHFGAEFGKTIKGFFSDETGFRNITSYDSLPGHPGMPMPWSPAYSAFFEKIKGYDPRPKLAALWYDTGASTRKIRYDLMDVYSRAFAENFFKPQQEWCHAHNVRLIGHLVEDNHADHQLGYGPGHWFRGMQYFDMPGIDVVGYQVTPGVDAGTYAWIAGRGPDWDEEHFSFGLPAMARGSAWMKHSTEIFAESFGAYGWSEGLRMLKWIGDWLIVNGINVISPHAVSMKFHDPDCPPHYNASAGNPEARYYSAWSEPFKRLQKLTVESEPVYDAVVLYTGESAWMGSAQNVAPVVRALETAQISTLVLPYEADWSGFRTVVLPYARYFPDGVLDRFAAVSGKVFVLEAWPEGTPAKLRHKAELTTLPELARQIEPAVRLDPPTSSVVVSRRKAPGGEWILLHNRSLRDTWRGHINAHVSRYDAATNHWFEAPEIELPPYGLWTLWTGAPPTPLQAAVSYRHLEEITGTWKTSAGIDAAPGDWRRWPKFAEFSGTVRYSRTITLTDPRGVALDLGEVAEIADLHVNGKPIGVRIAPPYRWDLSEAAHTGDNTIEIDITNTAQARWKDQFSHGDAVSGLLGPVWLLRTAN
jgi:hypothetical protein